MCSVGPSLRGVVRIFVIGVPFFVAIGVLVAVYRGFDSVKEHVYFNDLMQYSVLYRIIDIIRKVIKV